MFIGTRLMATYAGGTYVAAKLITVGMAVQIGNAADHLQHCMRHMTETIPELMKVFGPVGRICDAINSKPSIEPYPGAVPNMAVPLLNMAVPLPNMAVPLPNMAVPSLIWQFPP